MKRHPVATTSGLSRRTALGRAAAVGSALGLGSRLGRVAAQDATITTANHPIVGAWMATTPSDPAPGIFFADGTVIITEPISERGIHFTVVQLHSGAQSTYTGSVIVDGHSTVSEDGQSLIDDSPDPGPTIRDASGNVLRGGSPATGVQMGVGAPGFPAGTPTAGKPMS